MSNDSLTQYINAYNEARAANDKQKAIKFGQLAINDAKAELDNPNISEHRRAKCLEVIRIIKEYLDDPEPKAKSASTNPSESTIKSTDWFGAPIPDLKLKDIAGLQKVKDEFIVNIFAPMDEKYADIYRKFRGDERGLQVLLYGPPGTGKTHAVKCLAGEMGCKIAVVQIKDVMANLVGDGAKIISEIFEQAKQHEKCIIFFDEIDAIAASREDDDSRHTKEQLTTLLTNMDGFTSKTKPGQVRIVIAATNRPWALDSAVKRGGRFDTQIYVPLPDAKAREKLIALSLGKDPSSKKRVDVPCAPDVTLSWLTDKTEGYAGADIKAMCRQAISRPLKREIFARVKGRNEEHFVTRQDFEEIFASYINPTNEDSLMQFDAYSMNMDYNRKFITEKCNRIIIALYNGAEIEAYERKWFEGLYRDGFVEREFGEKYDLSFLEQHFKEDGAEE